MLEQLNARAVVDILDGHVRKNLAQEIVQNMVNVLKENACATLITLAMIVRLESVSTIAQEKVLVVVHLTTSASAKWVTPEKIAKKRLLA